MYVTHFNCGPKPKICRLKPVICRPAQEHSRHKPVMDCRQEPPCVVTDIPKRELYNARSTVQKIKKQVYSGVNFFSYA